MASLRRNSSTFIASSSRRSLSLDMVHLMIAPGLAPGVLVRESVERSDTNGTASRSVMPGLDPGIHQKKSFLIERMDCRGKPGNDERRVRLQRRWYDARRAAFAPYPTPLSRS